MPDRSWILARVARLDAEDYDARETAMRDLLSAGVAIEDILRSEVGRGSPERQARVGEILSRLRRHTESRAVRPTATEVTIRLTDRPVSEALRRWSDASKASVFLENSRVDEGKLITLDLDRVPMLKALDVIGEATGSTFQWDPRRRGYSMIPSQARLGPIAYAGPIRVSLQSLQITRSTTFTTPSMTSVSLNGMIDIEPGWPLFGIVTPFRTLEALDDKGRSLTNTTNRQTEYLQRTPDGQRSWWNVQLSAPEPDARSIKRLKIACRLLVADEMAVVDITDPKSDPVTTFGDALLRVVVETAETNEEVTALTLRIEAPQPDGPIPAASRAQGVEARVEAAAADGSRVEFTSFGTSPIPKGVRWSANFKGPLPASLRISVPIHLVEVPFEPIFEDLPLP